MYFYVYLIRSQEGFRYIGQTSDLKKRLTDHNSQICHSTKRGTNWQIIYYEQFNTRSEAMKREKWLKSGVGREWANNNIAGWSSSSGS